MIDKCFFLIRRSILREITDRFQKFVDFVIVELTENKEDNYFNIAS